MYLQQALAQQEWPIVTLLLFGHREWRQKCQWLNMLCGWQCGNMKALCKPKVQAGWFDVRCSTAESPQLFVITYSRLICFHGRFSALAVACGEVWVFVSWPPSSSWFWRSTRPFSSRPSSAPTASSRPSSASRRRPELGAGTCVVSQGTKRHRGGY